MIGIGSDHGGFLLKESIIKYLAEKNISLKDYGTYDENSVDYPNYAFRIGESIKNKEIQFGILICTTGIGMSIACNKVKSVRCAKVDTKEEAYLTRFHNNSNVLALSSKHSYQEVIDIVNTFLATEFSNEERHIRRINMITNYEEMNES